MATLPRLYSRLGALATSFCRTTSSRTRRTSHPDFRAETFSSSRLSICRSLHELSSESYDIRGSFSLPFPLSSSRLSLLSQPTRLAFSDATLYKGIVLENCRQFSPLPLRRAQITNDVCFPANCLLRRRKFSTSLPPASLELHRWQNPLDHGVPKFSGLPTLLRAPLAHNLDEVDIALVGVPFDSGASHPGTRFGPREIRLKSSMLRKRHGSTGVAPFSLCRVADVGDVILQRPWSGVESGLSEIAAFYDPICQKGISPLTAGGDHSITLPILRALAKKMGPVGLVHLDAHMDTSDLSESEETMGSKYWNGTPFSNAVEEGLLDPLRTVQIGIRGPVSSAKMHSEEWGMRVVPMEEFHELGPKKVAEIARKVVGGGPTYITFDVDALDPAYAPGTGSPEDGGLTTLEAQLLLRGLRGLNFVGADFVCCSPPWDTTGNTSRVAANMMFEMLCLLAESRSKNQG
eukprot:TRINITY_DN19759_c0_g1_i1.p1 TRINITY_DN19759_c0_g1~~TRINITY_DN19759_c0_g1_i1.p1  ORF type:complete len:462 (-),score=34.53 TRINITY_DN19759_c0_g1_i1:253-1638(-)